MVLLFQEDSLMVNCSYDTRGKTTVTQVCALSSSNLIQEAFIEFQL